MTGISPILETRKLTMRFGGVVAVCDIDFSIRPGELRCLIGPNGAGKSTFFKCLTSQYSPTSGSVFYKGEDVTGVGSHRIARSGVGIKTQVPSVFDGLSVRENIWLAARRGISASEARRDCDAVMDRLGLASIADQLVGRLAHGQRQWVEMGMVTMGKPALMLLDEPTAGMTREEVALTAELIREVNRDVALIVVEHDMQFIRDIASTVTVFHQGSVLVEDNVDRVLADQRVRDVYLGKSKTEAEHA